MALYGLPPSELEGTDDVARLALYQAVEALDAERRWNFMLDVSAVFAGNREHLAALAAVALPPERVPAMVEALQRKGR